MKWIATYLLLGLSQLCAAQVVLSDELRQTFTEGERAFNRQNYEEAAVFFSTVIEAEPEYYNAFLRRGQCNNSLGKYKEAIDDFTVVIDDNPRQTFAINSRAAAHIRLKQFDEAIADCNTVLGYDSKNTVAYTNRGFAKKGLGQDEAACKDWKLAKKNGDANAKIILKNNDCK